VARAQKKAQSEGRTIALSDESGFMLQPVATRTWAPRGQTPELLCTHAHDRISAISAITLSPVTQASRLYFALLRDNYDANTIEAFVRGVQRQLRRPVTFVWDRLAAHRTVAERLAGDARFEFAFLPAYSPELNPAELGWRHAKHHSLAGSCPTDMDQLEHGVREALSSVARKSELLHGFFRGSGLSL